LGRGGREGVTELRNLYFKNGFRMVTDSMTCPSWKSSERRNSDFEAMAA